MFSTLPPGVSISQILDNVEWCQLQECYTVEDPRSHQPPTSQSQTGLRGQYISTTPSKHFVNGHGLSYASHNGVRSPACASTHKKGPIYCPPFQQVRERGGKTHSNNSDVDMTPAHINIVPKNDQGVKPTRTQLSPSVKKPQWNAAQRPLILRKPMHPKLSLHHPATPKTLVKISPELSKNPLIMAHWWMPMIPTWVTHGWLNRVLFTLVCLHRTATLRATALATLKTAVMCT